MTWDGYGRRISESSGYGKGTGWRPDDCTIRGDWIYGSVRFSVGMWVGGAVSPNHLRGGRANPGAIEALQGNENASEPAQVIRCPVCGSWLSIPQAGLPEGAHSLHLVVKTGRTPTDVKDTLTAHIKEMEYVKEISVTSKGHRTGYMTITLVLEAPPKKLDTNDVEKLWNRIQEIDNSLEIASFRASRPGYFGIGKKFGRGNNVSPLDFEIYCPNPGCELNRSGIQYKEGVPCNPEITEDEKFPDGYAVRRADPPLPFTTRIPIPAYTVDEQIYCRCPTVVISTADKIARMAFEPRAASLFGNIDRYDPCYGYYRDPLLPEDAPAKKISDKEDIPCGRLLPRIW